MTSIGERPKDQSNTPLMLSVSDLTSGHQMSTFIRKIVSFEVVFLYVVHGGSHPELVETTPRMPNMSTP